MRLQNVGLKINTKFTLRNKINTDIAAAITIVMALEYKDGSGKRP